MGVDDEEAVTGSDQPLKLRDEKVEHLEKMAQYKTYAKVACIA